MAKKLIQIYRELSNDVDQMRFSAPVAYVYNPLAYARAPFETYLSTHGAGRKRVILVGMNPGPFGMAQTGIPFGDVEMVTGWMGITGEVSGPAKQHPKRPIWGFSCARREVSGTRLWTWASERFHSPQAFFATCLVINYCPLVFMEEGGKNRTPDKLTVNEQSTLFDCCDATLEKVVQTLNPEWALGVGAFAEKRLNLALARSGVSIGRILHPSPASPAANRGWATIVDKQLSELGVQFT